MPPALTAPAGVALLLLLWLGLGLGVAVVLLGVAGVGVSAVTSVGVGVAAGRFGTALLDGRLIALRRARAVLRVTLAATTPLRVAGARPRGLVGLFDQRVVRGIGVAAFGTGVSAVASGRVAAGRRGVSTVGV